VNALASAEGVAAITAGATLLAGLGLALVTIYTKRQDLALDRELAGLDDLRKLLDEGGIMLNDARRAWDIFGLAFLASEALSSDAKKQFSDLGIRMDNYHTRLAMRLGLHDPITDRFYEAFEALNRIWIEIVSRAGDSPDTDTKTHDSVTLHYGMFVKSGTAFIQAAAERAGTPPQHGRKSR
jgi:hypothetical protein